MSYQLRKDRRIVRSKLINARKNKGYTQKELAKILDITERQYQRLESGTSNGAIPVWQNLVKILKAPSIDYLLEQEADEIKPN